MWNIYDVCKYCKVLWNTRNTIKPLFPWISPYFTMFPMSHNIVHFIVLQEQHQFADDWDSGVPVTVSRVTSFPSSRARAHKQKPSRLPCAYFAYWLHALNKLHILHIYCKFFKLHIFLWYFCILPGLAAYCFGLLHNSCVGFAYCAYFLHCAMCILIYTKYMQKYTKYMQNMIKMHIRWYANNLRVDDMQKICNICKKYVLHNNAYVLYIFYALVSKQSLFGAVIGGHTSHCKCPQFQQ